MTVNVSIKYSKNHLYPKSLADADPSFNWIPWEVAEPIYLSSTDIVLVNKTAEEGMLELMTPSDLLTDEEKMDFFYDLANQLEQSLTWSDDGYTATLEFDDKYLAFVELLATATSDTTVTITSV